MSDIIIERLGLSGDGIAGEGYHPFTLPGEVVTPGRPPKVVTPSPYRIAPPCRHFGACGGCALQHASDVFLAEWKQEVVVRALSARGLSAPFRPIAVSPPNSRRRATLTGRRTKKTVQVGFHERASDHVVPLQECHLLRPALLAMLPALESVVRLGGSRKGALKMQMTESIEGIDLDVTGGKPLDGPLRMALASWAGQANVARLTWEGDPIAVARPPRQRFGPAHVVPPPGAFLQATLEGQAALVAAVRHAVGDAPRVVDLFAGCGTFSLPLAVTADVFAVEGDKAMVAALTDGWRQSPGLRPLAAEARDLFRRPLEPMELNRFDAVVIDPPRAGAEAQTGRLAQSTVPRIAAVSCNPITFARDAETLCNAGYSLDWVQVIDQFRWSGHTELVAGFTR
ncbi:class I SAM-dependent RNA methyltransferase [Oceanibium sediminis]|uniref:class I SAM-dependent RNA methyltransferase n=1 Tax=Oceanibium sediminis TaxID=2026339 RepID=UPI000DD376BA|nr:class I SAM-dependent RNA methyltransferase [Oceanibium sediminis]